MTTSSCPLGSVRSTWPSNALQPFGVLIRKTSPPCQPPTFAFFLSQAWTPPKAKKFASYRTTCCDGDYYNRGAKKPGKRCSIWNKAERFSQHLVRRMIVNALADYATTTTTTTTTNAFFDPCTRSPGFLSIGRHTHSLQQRLTVKSWLNSLNFVSKHLHL